MSGQCAWKSVLIGLACTSGTGAVEAGIFSKSDDCATCQAPQTTCAQPVVCVQEAPKKKKTKDAPRGPIVSSVGAVMTRGTAFEIDEESATDKFKLELNKTTTPDEESADDVAGANTRIDSLERDMKELKVMMARLSAVVEAMHTKP